MAENGGTPLRSATITGLATARAMLRPLGFTRERLARPNIGVAHMWSETGPCNFSHRQVAQWVKEGIEAAGGTAFEFSTISINDGITMGTQGMKGSLVSREVITDSIELVARSHMFDGLLVIVGCDKTIPAGAMALARLNLPGLVLYSGSIAPGRLSGEDLTIVSVFEAVGAHGAGRIDAAALQAIEEAACPGAGACGGQFTANTMACATEFLGLRPAGLALLSKRLVEAGLVHPDTRNVDGRTLGEIAAAARETPGQRVILPVEAPLKQTGGIEIMYGDPAPGGCVIKLAGHDRTRHAGPARVFEKEEDAFRPSGTGRIQPG